MSVRADVVNKVYDVLRAAVRTGGALDYFDDDINFGAIPQSRGHAYLVLRLSDEDSQENLVGATDRKTITFKVSIFIDGVDEQVKKDTGGDPRPYGVSADTTRRGILTMVEDVENVIDASYDALKAASGNKVVDVRVAGDRIGRTGEARKFGAEIRLEFDLRYSAGSR